VALVSPHQWSVAGASAAALAVALAASATLAAAQPPVTVSVAAGLGGLVKPGRWAPVLVDVESRGGGLATDLVVTWGDATLTRRVTLVSAGRRRFELYLRTAEAESVVRVRLEAVTPVTVEAPVTVVPHEEAVTLCIATPETPVTEPDRCSIVLPPERLPRSLRAYEIVDEVVTVRGASILPAAERTALERWRSLRLLETSGDLTLTAQVTRPMRRRGLSPPIAEAVMWATSVYLAGLLIAGLVVASRTSVSRAWLALGMLVAAGTTLALTIGRVGPASRVRVHHTSLIQQLPGATGSLLTLRGIAEFPAPGTFRLRMPMEEAMIEAAAASGRAPQHVGDDGFPELVGSFGLGGRQMLTAEGLLESQWLRVEGDDRTIHISNRSAVELRDCRFAEGLSPEDAGNMAPGASVTAQRQGEVVGPLFTCILPESPVTFTVDERAVDVIGSTQLVVYRQRPQVSQTLEPPND
jgi:hypothetical protein